MFVRSLTSVGIILVAIRRRMSAVRAVLHVLEFFGSGVLGFRDNPVSTGVLVGVSAGCSFMSVATLAMHAAVRQIPHSPSPKL